MRTVFFLAISFIILPSVLTGQSMMRMYRTMYSISGSYSSGHTNTDIKAPNGTIGADMDHETIRLSTRNGYFVARNVAVGFELNWDQQRNETTPQPNPTNYRVKQFDRNFFVGPLLRWCQPVSVRWFMYPEVSLGYRHYLGESEESGLALSTMPVTTSARGLGINVGAGIGYFLSRNIVLDATLRYSYNWLTGRYEVPGQPDIDAEIQGGEIGILFGLQLMM